MKHTRWLVLLLALVLVLGSLPGAADAAQHRKLPKTILESASAVREIAPEKAKISPDSIQLTPQTVNPGDARPMANPVYLTKQQAVVQLRQAMVNRAETFTLYVRDESWDYEDLLNEILAEVFVHTGNPKEGDYLLAHYGGIGGTVDWNTVNGGYAYTYTLEIAYLTDAAAEQQVNNAVASILSSLNVRGQSEYRRVKAVFDWLKANVSYDGNMENPYAYSAHGALVSKSANFQGYAAAFYRLMLELGMDTRMVAGECYTEHVWNIVKLGRVYYNVDTSRGFDYDYFLKNSAGFWEYARYLEYMTTQFHTDYPMAQDDYVEGVAGTPEYYYVAGVCGDNVYWAIDRDRQLTLAGEGATYDFNRYSTFGDKAPWEPWTDGFESVVVEEGITRIGTDLCGGMDNVLVAILPETLKEIGMWAFVDCANLSQVNLPSGLEKIGSRAFFGTALESVVIPDSVTDLGGEAFSSITTLEEAVVGNFGTTYPSGLFRWCSNLRSVTINEGNTYLGSYTFEGCRALTEVHIPSTVELIRWGAFKSSGLMEAVIPASVTEIEPEAYAECAELTSVVFEGNPTMGYSMFANCPKLTTVTMTDAMTGIPSGLFQGCTALTRVELGAGVRTIEDSAFAGTGLTEIVLPEGLTSIGYDAFRGCTGLTEITIPSTVTELNGFHGCSNLKTVNFVDSHVETIGAYAFYACRALESFEIPASVQMIDAAAFQYCSGLKEMYVPETVTDFRSGFPGCTALETVYLDHTDDIPGYAFSGCTALRNVYISENVTGMDACAFADCTALERIVIPGNVAAIYTTAFQRCTALREIYFLDNAPSLGESIFQHVTATAYYPGSNPTWTADKLQDYGGTITWVPMHDHSYGSEIVAPACIDVGYTLHTCADCDVSYRTDFVRPTGHDVVDWETVREATCTEPGQERRGCRNCDFGETREIPMIPHTLDSVVTEPTCTDEGFTTHTCTVCGHTYIDSIVTALGHDFCPWYYTEAPDCLNPGQERRDCGRCGIREDRMALPLGHDFVSGSCSRCAFPQPQMEGLSRLSGANRYLTGFAVAEQLKAMLGMERFGAVVVAYGQNFPDALTGSYLAAVKKAPILLTEAGQDANVLAYLTESLIPGGRVYILGGTAAVSQEFEDMAGEMGFHVIRLKGKSRYETNLAILEEAGVNTTDEVLIATGTNYADSLSASATGLPMVLVADTLTAEQREFLQGTSRNFVILGGTGAVSKTVENQLKTMGTVTRVKGASRYETSVEIAKRYFATPEAMVLAYAQGFPDGLCGGPLALSVGAPLILTSNESLRAADDYIESIATGAVTGGTGRISDETVREIFDLTEDVPIVKP